MNERLRRLLRTTAVYIPPEPPPEPEAPSVRVAGYIQSTEPGNYQVGVPLVSVAPVMDPEGTTLTALPWLQVGGATLGTSSAGYTPVTGDVGFALTRQYLATSPGGLTSIITLTAVGPVIAAATTGAPVVANQSLKMGRQTWTGYGDLYAVNTGGAATAAAIIGGADALKFQIDNLGKITPSAIGQGSLPASAVIIVRYTNASGIATATLTIDTEADGRDAATTAQLAAYLTNLGALTDGIDRTIWLRGGIVYAIPAITYYRDYTGRLRIRSRNSYLANPAVIDLPGKDLPFGGDKFAFEDVKFKAHFQRTSMSFNNHHFFLIRGGVRDIEFKNCDFDGGSVELGRPAGHFRGCFGVFNVNYVDLTNSNLRFIGGRAHGWSRFLNLVVQPANVGGYGAFYSVEGMEIYDIALDGVIAGGKWNSLRVFGNYFSSPYVDPTNIGFSFGRDNIFRRDTPWTGAANGKKLLFVMDGLLSGTTYAHQTTGGTPVVKLRVYYTNNQIGVQIRDATNALVVDLLSTHQFSGTAASVEGVINSVETKIAISVDTDRNAELWVWRSGDTPDVGTWRLEASQALAGQTLDLASGRVALGALPDLTDPGYGGVLRVMMWFGQAPDLSANTTVRDEIALPLDPTETSSTALVSRFGTPIFWMQDNIDQWKVGHHRGTGGAWSKIGAVEIGHGDWFQGIPNANVGAWEVAMNEGFAAFDTTRTRWDNGFYTYEAMHGAFCEDITTAFHYTGCYFYGNRYWGDHGDNHGISLYNPVDCYIVGNTCWSLGNGNKQIGIERQSSGTGSGNVMADNVAPLISAFTGFVAANQNNVRMFPLTSGAPTSMDSLIAGQGGQFRPYSRASFRAMCAAKAGGQLATSTPKIGADVAYFDHDLGIADHPRLSTAAGFDITDVSGVTPGALTTSAGVVVGAITRRTGGAAANGVWVAFDDGATAQVRVETGGGAVVTDWTSAALAVAGQVVKVRDTADAGGLTKNIRVFVGGARVTWTLSV